MTSNRCLGAKSNPVIPWSRALLEKATVPRLFKKFPTFSGTRRFTAIFTRRRYPEVPILSQVNPLHAFPTIS
jgi:hypothetical protein